MLTFIADLLSEGINQTDKILEKTVTPTQLVLIMGAAFLFREAYPILTQAYRSRHNKTLQQRTIDWAYQLGKNIPPVKSYVKKELDKDISSVQQKTNRDREGMELQGKIPERGMPVEFILKQFGINLSDCHFDFKAVQDEDVARKFIVKKGDGKDSGALYAVYPQELREAIKEANDVANLTNPMHDKWKRITAMRAEVLQWCKDLFHSSSEGYGIITHGGTTSIIEAIAAYVIHARAKGIQTPEIVVPQTAHIAFHKAAQLTGARIITVPVNQQTGAVSAAEMEKYLSPNTAVIVGSAPSFMNGIADPINDLGELAKKHQLPLHVDACLGGFLTVFCDTSQNPMDFRVEGVTSISADLHKYGYNPKGISVCLFSKDSPVCPVYSGLNWPGGLYTTAGLLDGSVSGAPVAAAYTVMSYYGREKYQQIAQDIISLRQRIQEQAKDIEGIKIFGDPQWSILGFYSDTLNPHAIYDELKLKGWELNALQNPAGFHICLTHVHTLVEGFEQMFIQDLRDSVSAVKNCPSDKKPHSGSEVKVYGTVSMLPTEVQQEVCIQYQKARQSFTPTFFPLEDTTKIQPQTPSQPIELTCK